MRSSERVNEIIFQLEAKLLQAVQIVENDVFSENLDLILSEVEEILKEIVPVVSELIGDLNSGKISFPDFSEVVSKFYNIEELFLKLISGLQKISDSDSKRIEQISNIQNQLRSAYQLSSRGTHVKKKT